MCSTTKVSVLMTAYNRQKYIGEAIESVLTSVFTDLELIIVDDCSKDKTLEIINSYAAIDKRIKVYSNKNNLGDYANRNKAASYAIGRYLVNVDSDDKMYPDALAKWVNAMDMYEMDFGIFAKMGNTDPIVLTPEQSMQKHFFEKPILMFGPGATVVSNCYFQKMKGFPEKYGPANDMYHHLKLAAGTNCLFFPFPLIDYRIHDAQELNNKYGYLYNNYNYLRDALEEIELPLSQNQIKYLSKKNKRRFLTNVISYWIETRDFHKTIIAVKKAQFKFRDCLTAIFQ